MNSFTSRVGKQNGVKCDDVIKKKCPLKFHWMFNTPITPRNTLYSSKCFQESETNYDH